MSQSKPEVLLKHYLSKLKLPTILREYQSVAAVCTKERCDYTTFLLRLIERESMDREKRAAERRVKNARFPVIKTLDTFDFGLQPSINEQLLRELMVGEYIEKKENVLMVGTVAQVKHTWPVHLALQHVCRAGRCASLASRNWLHT